MEKLESQEKVINLGKFLVKQLNLDKSVDTLGRWMAHYLALKISEAENAKGKDKIALEEECFKTILEIWKHRWKMPSNTNPINNFQPIFDFLVKLNPNRNEPFYFSDLRENISEESTTKSIVNNWLEVASHFDKYARICVNYALANATAEITSEEQLNWFQNSPNLTRDIDIKIIKILLDRDDKVGADEPNSSEENFIKGANIEKLKYNINFLENHQKLHRQLLKDLKDKLAAINPS